MKRMPYDDWYMMVKVHDDLSLKSRSNYQVKLCYRQETPNHPQTTRNSYVILLPIILYALVFAVYACYDRPYWQLFDEMNAGRR